jgi:hypothetical protein
MANQPSIGYICFKQFVPVSRLNHVETVMITTATSSPVDQAPSRSRAEWRCQKGHILQLPDIDQDIRLHVLQRLRLGETQLPIHPDSCLLCQEGVHLQPA